VIYPIPQRPKLFDPSELRTDVTGKVVRYLHENGATVEAGQPYVEVEAMKMIIPIKSTESGKITNSLSPGSVINAGDLLATLELKDPSKTQKIENFEGSLEYKTSLDTDPKELATYLLAGFKVGPMFFVFAEIVASVTHF
jgi:acetyl-CoA carboxylase/biotin carboxylase 1